MHHLSRLILSISLAVVLTATAFANIHTVSKGDNDYSIAKKYGISVEQLHKLNPKTNWKSLQIGQKLTVSVAVAKSKTKTTPVAKTKSVSVKTTGSTASITKTDVIVRSAPTTSSDKKGLVDKGQNGAVIERRAGWTKVKFSNNLIGWVRDDMVSVKTVAKSSPVAKNEAAKPVAKAGALPETPVKDTDALKSEEALKAKSVASVVAVPEPEKTEEAEKIIVTNVPEASKPAVVAPPLKAQGFYADKRAFISADSVIIRSAPSTSSTRKATVSKGRTAEVLQRGSGSSQNSIFWRYRWLGSR